MQNKILVLGGTGLLGQPVARRLKESGFQVRIMTRDLQSAKKMFDSSFEVFAGDLLDADCLAEALDGCYGVHISLPNEVEQPAARLVARLASRHGVQRISYISGRTVAAENRWFPMVERKFLAEKAIVESGVGYTIFCPTWVMESLPLFVRQGQATVIGKQSFPYHWVAAEDVARMVAAAYGQAEAVNRRFILHGPEAVRMDEALRRYCAAFHPEIKKVSSLPIWLVRLMAPLTGNRELKGVGQMMAYFDKVGENGAPGAGPAQADAILGAPEITLERWLETLKAG